MGERHGALDSHELTIRDVIDSLKLGFEFAADWCQLGKDPTSLDPGSPPPGPCPPDWSQWCSPQQEVAVLSAPVGPLRPPHLQHALSLAQSNLKGVTNTVAHHIKRHNQDHYADSNWPYLPPIS